MRRAVSIALVVAASSTAACSAILGLDAPPEPDAGAASDATMPSDDGGGDDASATNDGAPPDTATPTCTALDASVNDAGPYAALNDPTAWTSFDARTLASFGNSGSLGGTFDGRYVYFAGRAARVARYDTEAGDITSPSAWELFYVSTLGVPGGFGGAAFDGRYVYFVPYLASGAPASVAARFDTFGSFTAASSWATFDLATLGDGGVATSGFLGAVFDTRYLYFVPRSDGAPDGRVVRYDTSGLLDAGPPGEAGVSGDGGDAGDGGVASEFGDTNRWSTFDVSSTNPAATGYAGGVFASGAVYLVPYANEAFDAEVHAGGSGITARYATTGTFTASTSWTTFDTTTVNGLAETFWGGAFDGKYVYFAPHAQGIVPRYDTATGFGTLGSWSAYDTTRVAVLDGGTTPGYTGSAYDGRFVYLLPNSGSTLIRYDTASTFTADCAWSTFDVDGVVTVDGGVSGYQSAVFDGQYVYLIPDNNGLFLRFDATVAGPLPNLPAFHGSFL